MKEAWRAWQQMQPTLSLWYEILASYKYISLYIRDDWQKNMIKRVTFTVDETEKSAWISKHHWHPVSTVGTQISVPMRKPKATFPLSAFMICRIMLFDFRQLRPQHLNAGFRQLPAGSKRRMTGSPCWPFPLTLRLSTDMPHLFTNPPTLGNAARSC